MAATTSDDEESIPSQLSPGNLTDKQQRVLQIIHDDPEQSEAYYIENYDGISNGYVRYLNKDYPSVVEQVDFDSTRCEFRLTESAIETYIESGTLAVESEETTAKVESEETADDVESEEKEIEHPTPSEVQISFDDDALFELVRNHPDPDFARTVFDTVLDDR